MTKEEIKQAAESNWDEINSQFKYGLNPYAHRVGFIEGVKWATQRLKAERGDLPEAGARFKLLKIQHEESWTAGIIDYVLSRSNNNTDKFIINLKKVGYKVVKIESENERLKAESIPEYISRLKEVLKNTGQLTETDIDYVYYLMEYDLQPPKQ